MAQRDILTIGGSLGSTAVLRRILGALQPGFPAAIFVATHVASGRGSGYLAETLAGATALPVSQAVDGQPIEQGRVYVAAPDYHLLLMEGTVALGTGPRENMARPAIDPLFRSAALSHGPRVIGLVLTGLLNDGASGLRAIKQAGGTTLVQHPLDAEAPDMPTAALGATEVDHAPRVEQLPSLLEELVRSEAGPAVPVPGDLKLEVAIAAGRRLGSEQLRRLAEPSALTCPHCQGVLSEVMDDKPLRFRCQIGHGFTAESILATQGTAGTAEAVRIAMRLTEERVELVSRMARDARANGRSAVAELYEARAAEYGRYAATLREAATLDLEMCHRSSARET